MSAFMVSCDVSCCQNTKGTRFTSTSPDTLHARDTLLDLPHANLVASAANPIWLREDIACRDRVSDSTLSLSMEGLHTPLASTTAGGGLGCDLFAGGPVAALVRNIVSVDLATSGEERAGEHGEGDGGELHFDDR